MADAISPSPHETPELNSPDLHVPLTPSLPFAIIALAAELTVVLPPGPRSPVDAVMSAVFLGATAVSFSVHSRHMSRRSGLISIFLYLVSTLWLLLASKDPWSIGVIVLVPVVWAALNLEFWQTLVVVVVSTAIELTVTYVPNNLSWSDRLRREGAYLFIGGLIALSVHGLRNRIARSIAERESRSTEMASVISELDEQNHATSILSNLVEMLHFCDVVEEAYEVFDFAAEQLFPTGGSIEFVDDASGVMQAQCVWGDRTTWSVVSSHGCLAIKSGQPYESKLGSARCDHLRHVQIVHTLCHPLIIQGGVVGLLSVTVPTDSTSTPSTVDPTHLRQYARLLGDQISIWLANFKLRESLNYLAIRDPLTNLFNRRFMVETLEREMAITTRSHDQTSIIQVDIDHFKSFNDLYGHAVGDAVLCGVAEVMLGLFRESDVPCRSGGEEFTLILPRCSWEIANIRAIELQARVAGMTVPATSHPTPLTPPTLSIGIATSPENGQSGEELLHGADMALYAAKSSGRNRIVRAAVLQSAHVTPDVVDFGAMRSHD
jgi:diguanylate cyclase (GGDEF)-like protein